MNNEDAENSSDEYVGHGQEDVPGRDEGLQHA